MGDSSDSKGSPEGLHKQCQDNLYWVVSQSKKIASLVDKLEEIGCSLPKNFFACRLVK
jgi:hypothetical protein